VTGAGADPAGPLDRALGTLTPDQRRAVESPAEALAVLAGAGSGKTRVLTLRAARRIAEGTAEADHTVVVTFTRRAAWELRGRLMRLGVPVAGSSTGGGVPGPGVRAGTLHQLALTLVRRHALDARRPAPRVVEHRGRLLVEVTGDPDLAAAVGAEVGWAKACRVDPDAYPAAASAAGRHPPVPARVVADHFRAYQALLARRETLDLDDVLVRAADLVDDDPAFAEGVRWRYRHLSVDEFQDVNPAQYRLLTRLLGGRRDLLAVGDPDQAIYGWNGADPGLLARLPSLVRGMEVVRLDTNHRSSPQVVAAAAAALGPEATGLPRSAAADGPPPVVTAYDDDVAEAEGVATLLARSAGAGRPWSAHAVLARTNDQLRAVGTVLARRGVPHRLAPGPEAPGRPPGPEERDAVELATFHRAKGLEWPWVAVVGVEDGLVPIVHATGAPALAEERRLLYVALTRAGQELHCSWARRRTTAGGRQVDRTPSPWLAAVEAVSATGSGRPDPVDTGTRMAALRAALGT
jgi:DNA helicase-2/ATP-dependent DNA helicase PcrA